MSISSISSSEALYWASLAKSANTTAATATADESTSLKKITSSTNSSSTQDNFAELMSMLSAMYAGNAQSNTSEDNSDSDLRSFLDKVKNGTVTAEDLTNLQALLADDDLTFSTQNDSTSNDVDSSLTAFLNKVKNGTVTTEDLTSLQALLANDGKIQSNQNYQQPYQQLLTTAADAYETDYQSNDLISSAWKV